MSDDVREASGGSRLRVVVIDDDIYMGRMVARLIRSDSVAPELFHDPGEALQAVASGGADVIVSDILMPGIDGIELIRRLRRFDLDTPVILLTGTPTVETAARAVEFQAFRYLTKPLNIDEMRSAVSQAAFAHRIAKIRRDAAEAQGLPSQVPGDIAGLSVALDMALDSLWIAYQPIVRAKDGSVFGYEALMRSDSKTLPHPGAILSAAEALGRLNDIGRMVRRKAPEPLRDLDREIALFLNLHPRDLLDENLLAQDSPLAAISSRVVLEITERASLDRVPKAVDTIAWLRALHYRVAVDDLGSGYAGLTSLATLEPDFVKVDMTLIRGIDTNTTKQRLLWSIAELSRDMGKLVVAEGIETAAERDFCVALGVDLLQGFLIATPGRPFPEVAW